MGKQIETTTRELREGVELGEPEVEVRYESTGHLSVRLLDASGTAPVARRQVKVGIPEEGEVELTTDADGKIFHADVPFQDYELDLGDDLKVMVPAVAVRTQVHVRHVPDSLAGFADVLVRDPDGMPLAEATVTLEGPGGPIEARTDRDGRLVRRGPLPPGTYTLKTEDAEVELELPALPRRVLAWLEGKGE